jgi:hypothetical protein
VANRPGAPHYSVIVRRWIDEHHGAQVAALLRASSVEPLRHRLCFIDYNGELHVHSSIFNVVLHDQVFVFLMILT